MAELRPDLDIALSLPGQFHILLQHIDVHRYYLSQHQQKEIPYEEAVLSWVDNIYLPMVEVIREQRIMDNFSDRNEADLYLWIIEHLAFIQQRYPSGIDYREAASDFSRERKFSFTKIVRNIKKLFGK